MTESDRITQLDDATIRKIAAGEVVERPASAVKELIENSLDADADRIDVTVEAGGTERIVVSDDGIGMSEADLRAAVREHTTSKIEDIDDLESGVTTLGFRGEALHTISAVSRTTITSKPRGGESSGERATELRMEGGEVESVGPAGRPEGTTVEVADLFYNTPARRKYLKTTATEFSHVNTVVTRYALANPDVAVSLTHDDREVFATTGRGDLQSALLSVYGREVAASMIEVAGEGDEVGRERDDSVSVSGYVGDPETTRSTREYVSTYVNGRYVSSPTVREAVLSAYGGQLSAERYPFAVLFLDVDPSDVDVNVHPRKLECRWENEGTVREAVESAVESALLDHGLVRSSAPRGRSTPDEARVEPEREAGTESDRTPGVESEGESRGDSERERQSKLVASGEPEQSTLDETPETDGRTEARSSPTSARSNAEKKRTETFERNQDISKSNREFSEGRTESGGAPSASESRASTTPETDADRKFAAPTEAETLAGDPTADPEFETLPRMRVLGQLHDTYVVAETPDGLVLVDQHAADERVNYERLREAFADDATTQMLAQPVELELTAGEAALFDEYREPLEQLGFRAERADRRSADGTSGEAANRAGDADERGDTDGRENSRRVVVRTAPTVLDATLDPELLRDALGEFVSTDPDERGDTVEAVADDLLADLACYPSITGNTSLREGSVVELLRELDDCENPYACPHGRPVIIEFGEEEIEDRFERDYPGHAGRREED